MKILFTSLILCLSLTQLLSQNSALAATQDSISRSDIDYSKRKKIFWAAGATGYTAMATGLYFAWYDQYEQESFHFFNDWDEWRNVDKLGHSYSAYFQASLINEAAQWAGFSDKKALNIACLASIWGQLNIELMDGFSRDWGFSATDLGANVLGTGLYYAQEKTWGEQRLTMKMSYWPVKYSTDPLNVQSAFVQGSLADRADVLYGSGLERFLKDYNAQTIWVSANISSFFPDSRIPKWLSLAFGYSAKNLYGGFDNTWENGAFTLDPNTNPRSSQFVLGLDFDLRSVYHSTAFGTALFKALNIFKFPMPAISYDTVDGVAFHLVFLN